MLKRILVLVAETPSSVAARRYAFRLAQENNAQLAALAGVDLTNIETRMPGGVGASAYKTQFEEQQKKSAETALKRLHQSFELECKDHNIPFEWQYFDGDPLETLYLASETRDVMVTGHDTAFCGGSKQNPSELLGKLLMATPRPVIICPDVIPSSDDVLISYDGSVPAMRAVQMFVLLGIGRGRRITVTSIDADRDLAARRTSSVAVYLRSHGYEVSVNPIASRIHPAEALKVEMSGGKFGMLVMGAYGHRGFRDYLFGSTTSAIAERPPSVLFVYH